MENKYTLFEIEGLILVSKGCLQEVENTISGLIGPERTHRVGHNMIRIMAGWIPLEGPEEMVELLEGMCENMLEESKIREGMVEISYSVNREIAALSNINEGYLLTDWYTENAPDEEEVHEWERIWCDNDEED